MKGWRSKIGKLPPAIREELNQRLYENAGEQRVILTWLNDAAGLAGATISEQNLSDWRNTGFKEWQDDQEQVHRTRKLAELSWRLAEVSGPAMSQGLLSISAGRILEAIEGAEGTDIADLTKGLATIRAREIDSSKLLLEQKKIDQKDAELAQKERSLALEESKFQRQTAVMFLKFYKDQRAKEIAEQGGDEETKVGQLIQLWFSQMPPGIGPQMNDTK